MSSCAIATSQHLAQGTASIACIYMLQLRMGCRPLPFGSTNNEAEYSGMIAGLRVSVVVWCDVTLLVVQWCGVVRI